MSGSQFASGAAAAHNHKNDLTVGASAYELMAFFLFEFSFYVTYLFKNNYLGNGQIYFINVCPVKFHFSDINMIFVCLFEQLML